ncbi:hypothetical protein [Sulfobacillus thermosulfidooxidans]|nr:hypothetical protein [Sulfobacillus thermosulfidooxidans]
MGEITLSVLEIGIRRNPALVAGSSGEMFQEQIGADSGLLGDPNLP